MLVYNSKGGISMDDVRRMTTAERAWFMERLAAQIKRENKALKNATQP